MVRPDWILPKAAQDELSEKFERVEADVLGAEAHERFRRLIDALEGEYVAP